MASSAGEVGKSWSRVKGDRGQRPGGITTSHPSEPLRVRRPWGRWQLGSFDQGGLVYGGSVKRTGTLGSHKGKIPLTQAGAAEKIDSPSELVWEDGVFGVEGRVFTLSPQPLPRPPQLWPQNLGQEGWGSPDDRGRDTGKDRKGEEGKKDDRDRR